MPPAGYNPRMGEFTSPFDITPTTRVVFGSGSLDRLGELAFEQVRVASRPRALLVTDPGIVAAGHAPRAVRVLRDAGFVVHVFDGVAENPTTAHVEAGVAFVRAANGSPVNRATQALGDGSPAPPPAPIELIVGIGGGSSMDCAKGVNFILSNGGVMSDYWGVDKATRPMIPLIAVPTTAGTGSEAQSFALIADAKTHQKMACGDKKAAPAVAILDPDLTRTQPRLVAAATGLDALAHAVETYVCNRASPYSRMLSSRAWGLLSMNFERALARPDDCNARAAMLLGAHFAGAAIECSMLGAAHACANPLTSVHGVVHGLAVSVMLPHVIRFNAEAAADRYVGLDPGEFDTCENVGAAAAARSPREGAPATAALRIARAIERLLDFAGVPRRLSDHGAQRDRLADLAGMAAGQWTARFNPRPVSVSDFLNLYEAAF